MLTSRLIGLNEDDVEEIMDAVRLTVPRRPILPPLRVPGIISVQEAAKLLTTSDSTVKRLIRKGNIEATKVGKKWKISRRSVERLLPRDLGGDDH